MTTPDMNRIADEREISDVVIRYTWALDHRRFDDLADVFCEDATADYGRLGVFKGPAAIGQAAAGSLGRFDRTQHIVSNHRRAEAAKGSHPLRSPPGPDGLNGHL